MTPLPYLAIYKVSGADAGTFLHAQLAADTASLADGESCFAAYCSPRGQVIALLLVCRRAADWFYAVEAGLASLVRNRLMGYVLRAKVTIEALDKIQVAGLFPDEESPAQASAFKPRGLTLRYVLTANAEDDGTALTRWRHEEMKRGVTWLQGGTSERFLPQMLGIDAIGAVSFSKGCYPGQEVIARTRYLGKLKRRPVLLEINGSAPVNPGERCVLVTDGDNTEGIVVGAACAGGQNATALLVVAALEADRPLSSIEYNAKSWPARRIGVAGG